jgi:hypothetical protein
MVGYRSIQRKGQRQSGIDQSKSCTNRCAARKTAIQPSLGSIVAEIGLDAPMSWR